MRASEDGDPTQIVGEAVLRDYPVRIWARQQEHSDEVLREFKLLVSGARSGEADGAPAALVALAELFSDRFGRLVDEITATRLAALESGADRMDWRVPLPRSTPELLRQVQAVWATVDEYCRSGDLLALARPADVVALQEWSTGELLAQYDGAEPTPWRGPF